MNVSRPVGCAIAVAMAMFATQALSQGFAGLGTSAEGFQIPQRGYKFEFPRDHTAHPDFRIEWWYVTANLVAKDGRHLGAQWTLFRSAMSPGEANSWSDPQIWIGHAAVTSAERHFVSEKLARGGVGQAGVTTTPFEAWIDDWEMAGNSEERGDEIGRLRVKASGDAFSYDLALDAAQPSVLQGDQGYSVKSASGQASYYYSQPFYDVRGTVEIDGEILEVSGKAWLDREWSSQPLAAKQSGWEWFSIHLGSGDKLMAFRLRDGEGGYVSANWITPDGRTETLSGKEVTMTPLRSATMDGRAVPIAWRLEVPAKGLSIATEPLNEQSWMRTSTPYWEGPISFSGSASGVGYLEMTGY